MAFAACGAVGLTAKVDAGVVYGTTTMLVASNAAPGVNEPVTFTARLSGASGMLANKPITIYHYFNNVRYNDVVNKLTDGLGGVSVTVQFTSPGVRDYYATFAGETTYAASSGAVKVTVNALPSTQLYLQATTAVVPVNKPLTFIAFLATNPNNPVGLPNKPVTIYHYFKGVRYDDVVNKLTDGTGRVSVTVPFTSTGVREYLRGVRR